MPTEFRDTAVVSAIEIISTEITDNRGSFLNAFRRSDPVFSSAWGNKNIEQINLSVSTNPGTIRGLHLQKKPFLESKIVRCIEGRIWDVCVDLRPFSPSYLKYAAIELTPEKSNSLFIPEGCAHGWQALDLNSKMLYVHSQVWNPLHEIGFRYDDPTLSIPWPLEPCNVSERDLSLPFIES